MKVRQQKTSSEATITLPPYTAAISGNNRKNRRQWLIIKCPVLINYDVTIVGYNAAATYVLGTFSGSNARASLKNRAVLHPTDTDKDGISWTNIKNDQTADKAINRISRNVLMCTAGVLIQKIYWQQRVSWWTDSNKTTCKSCGRSKWAED